MPLEITGNDEKCVVWVASGMTRQGEATIDEPVEIDCRWEETMREGMDPRGDPVTILADVCIDYEELDVPINSIVWRGELDDLPSNGIPPSGIMEVVGRRMIPDIKSRYRRVVLFLSRHNGTLPEFT